MAIKVVLLFAAGVVAEDNLAAATVPLAKSLALVELVTLAVLAVIAEACPEVIPVLAVLAVIAEA